MAPQKDRRQSPMSRLARLEEALRFRKVREAAIVSCGILFWGVSSRFVYDKLDDISMGIERIYRLESRMELLEYRADRQDHTNTNLFRESTDIKRDLDNRIESLNLQIDKLQGSNQ